MAGLIGIVTKTTKNFLDVNTISIDNWTFKCFYKVSTTVCIFSSVLATARQFFGTPIACDAGSVGEIDQMLEIASYRICLYLT